MAKFPLFRSLPEENFKLVTIADMSKGVMALLVDLAYGLDRFSHECNPSYLNVYDQALCRSGRT